MSESNKIFPAAEKSTDISSLSIRQIITALKPVQVWAVLVAAIAVLSGTFGIGYKLSDYVAGSEISSYKTENIKLKDKIQQFRAIQTKERFLALYLRYMIAKEAYSGKKSEDNKKSLEQAGLNLRSYIKKLLKRGEEASDEIDLRGLFLGKGVGQQATVKFGYDGSVWPVPREFGFAALSR